MSRKRIDKAFIDHYQKFWGYLEKEQGDESQDILQEVYCNLIDGIDLLAHVENLFAYIFRAVRNKMIDFRRKKRPDLGLETEMVSAGKSAEDDYQQNELLEIIEEALDVLPDNQKEIFMATELEGLTFREIAERSGESINTLLSRKRYAMQTLKKEISRRIE